MSADKVNMRCSLCGRTSPQSADRLELGNRCLHCRQNSGGWTPHEDEAGDTSIMIRAVQESDNYQVVAQAAYGLAKAPDESAVESLVQRLADPKLVQGGYDADRAREAVVLALGATGSRAACEPMVEAARTWPPELREHAIRALGKLGDARAVDWLSELLANASPPKGYPPEKSENNVQNRVAAATALGEIGDTRASNVLLQWLEPRHWLESGKITAAAIPALEHAAAPQDLSIMLLRLDSLSDRFKGPLTEVVARLAQRWTPEFLQAIKEADDGGVRRGAQNVLDLCVLECESPQGQAWLVACKEDWPSLVDMGDEGVEPLIAILADYKCCLSTPGDLKHGRYVGLVAALAKIDCDHRLLGPLIALGPRHDKEIERILCNCTDPAAIPLLLDAMKQAEGRRPIIKALGLHDDPRVIEVLATAAREGMVYHDALDSLAQIGSEQAIGGLLAAVPTRGQEATKRLAAIGGPQVWQHLFKLLRSDDQKVRDAAAWHLDVCDDPQVVDRLIDALPGRPRGSQSSLYCLRKIASPRALGPLLKLLDASDRNDSWRRDAEAAVVACGGPMVEPLVAAYRAQDKPSRRQALKHWNALPAPSDDSQRDSYDLAASYMARFQAEEKKYELIEEIEAGRIDDVRRLLDEGIDVNCRSEQYEISTLEMAAKSGHLAVFELLLERGVKPAQHKFAVWEAATSSRLYHVGAGHEEILRRLLAAGANPHLGRFGDTPLHDAATPEIIHLLLEHRADPFRRNENGVTPLDRAHAVLEGLTREPEISEGQLHARQVDPQSIEDWRAAVQAMQRRANFGVGEGCGLVIALFITAGWAVVRLL